MRSSVPNSSKPDPLESALRSAFNQGEPCDADGNPIVEDRTITYPLIGGGFFVDDCPEWCTQSHADDIQRGLGDIGDLVHESDPVAISFITAEGTEDVILSASIRQWPHTTDRNGSELPHASLMAEAGSGEDLGYFDAGQLDIEIQRVQRHLIGLRVLAERVTAARVADHKANARGRESITLGDTRSMPIPYLLDVLGVTIVEQSSKDADGNAFLFSRPDGTGTITVDRTLPPVYRDQLVRELLGRLTPEGAANFEADTAESIRAIKAERAAALAAKAAR